MGSKKLSGQRALVTGASSGIGAELARVLAEHGANLVLTARRADRLEALAVELRQKHGVEALVIANDLERPDAPQALFDATEGKDLAVDVLVNNAGFGAYEDFLDVPWATTAGMMQVNMVALTQLQHLFLPKMVARRHGHVMNVASVGAYMPCPSFAVYAATKAYVRNMTEAVDFELKGTGVRAISVSPGGTTTEFLDRANQRLKGGMSSMAMMSAERCARIAVKKMLAGRRNVVTGFMNALTVWLLRFMPRATLPWLAYTGMASAVDKAPKKQLTTSAPLATPALTTAAPETKAPAKV